MAGLALEDDDAFAALQARLRPFSQVTEAGQLEERTVLAIPSLNYGEEVLGSHASELAALEERFLYLVFALRRPGARLVLVTSEPIPEPVVDYYVGLIPEVPDARERFHLLTPAERSLRPLSRKLLDRPELLAELAAHRAHAKRAQQRLLGVGRVQPRGDDRAAGRRGRGHPRALGGVDRHPVVARDLGQRGGLALGREALVEVLLRVLGQDDHAIAPRHRAVVQPAQPPAERLGGVRPRASGIGELRDADVDLGAHVRVSRL